MTAKRRIFSRFTIFGRCGIQACVSQHFSPVNGILDAISPQLSFLILDIFSLCSFPPFLFCGFIFFLVSSLSDTLHVSAKHGVATERENSFPFPRFCLR